MCFCVSPKSFMQISLTRSYFGISHHSSITEVPTIKIFFMLQLNMLIALRFILTNNLR